MGGGDTQVVSNVPPPTAAETQLTGLQVQLAQKQLANIDTLAPFQQQLLVQSSAQLSQNAAYTDALNKLISPEQQAQAQADQFARAQKLGPIQDQLLQAQLDQIKQGSAATPQQLSDINAATEAGISAGSSDIDAQTARGIGLISDELANSRGLRLSDSPIGSEAALLSREGLVQKGSLTKNLQAAGATAKLNYPLAASSTMSAINQGQQNILSAATNFQDQLRQQAYQNRLALSGTASSGGLGLASIGAGSGALDALSRARLAGTSSSTSVNPSVISQAAQGAEAAGAAYLGYLALA